MTTVINDGKIDDEIIKALNDMSERVEDDGTLKPKPIKKKEVYVPPPSTTFVSVISNPQYPPKTFQLIVHQEGKFDDSDVVEVRSTYQLPLGSGEQNKKIGLINHKLRRFKKVIKGQKYYLGNIETILELCDKYLN